MGKAVVSTGQSLMTKKHGVTEEDDCAASFQQAEGSHVGDAPLAFVNWST